VLGKADPGAFTLSISHQDLSFKIPLTVTVDLYEIPLTNDLDRYNRLVASWIKCLNTISPIRMFWYTP